MRANVVAAIVVALLAGCGGNAENHVDGSPIDSTRMTAPSIETVLERHTPHLMSIPGVVGTAQGEEQGAPIILVFVKKKDDAIRRAIPTMLEGYAVRVDEVGEVRPIR
jgi:hypothetical protein